MADARPLVYPHSLAIVGATPRRPEAVAQATLGRIPVWPVNPRYAEVAGIRCFPSVSALPEIPEVALLLVRHDRILEALEEAAGAGVRAFLVPGVGAEAGRDAAPLAAALAERCRELEAVMLGPNCMGVAVPGETSTWLSPVPRTAARGHVSTICQSGSVGDAFLGLGGRIGLRAVVSSGAESVTDTADYLALFAADEATRAIGLFLETVRRPDAFRKALTACSEAGKPVVCLKVGRSRAGARAALAHTGAIVGSSRAFSAVLRGHGVIEVDDFHELVETLELLGRKRRPRGRRLGAISESGGECALLADHAEVAGLCFEPLSGDLATALKDAFPNYLSPGNPLDAWAIDEPEHVYPGSLELMARSGEFDVLVAQVDLTQFRPPSEQEWCELVVRALADVTDGTGLLPVVTTIHSADPAPHIQELAHDRDVALLRGTREGLRALAHVIDWSPVEPHRPHAEPPVDVAELEQAAGPLPEHESALVLERYGVEFAPRLRAAGPREAARAATELGFPVVVKVDGPTHKADVGGVVLGVETPEDAAEAAARIGGRVLVAKQLPPGLEAICGMTRDPQFGPVLAVGRGGSGVERRADVSVAVAPVDRASARALVQEAGITEAVDALAGVLVAISRLALDHPDIAEIDVNPVIVRDDSATAVDALVVLAAPGAR